jgi:hypothetical protein
MRGKHKFGSLGGIVVTCKGLQQVTQLTTHFTEGGERSGKNQYPGGARQTWREVGRSSGTTAVGRSFRVAMAGRSSGVVPSGRCSKDVPSRRSSRAASLGTCSGTATVRRSSRVAPSGRSSGFALSGRCLGVATVRRSLKAAPSRRSSLGADEDEHRANAIGEQIGSLVVCSIVGEGIE